MLKKSLFILLCILTTWAKAQTALPKDDMMIGIATVDIAHLPANIRADYQPYSVKIPQPVGNTDLPYVLRQQPLMNHLHIRNVYAGIDVLLRPAIYLELTEEGQALLQRITTQYQGKTLAVVDDSTKTIVSVPHINEPITSDTVEFSGIAWSEITELVQRLRQNFTLYLVSDKSFSEELAPHETVMYQKAITPNQAITLFVNQNYRFTSKDFTYIEWQETSAESIFGEIAKEIMNEPVYVIAFKLAPHAKQKFNQLAQQYTHHQANNQKLGSLILWTKSGEIEESLMPNMDLDYADFYLYTLSRDEAEKLWDTLRK